MDRGKPLWEILLVEGLETVDGIPPGSMTDQFAFVIGAMIEVGPAL